MQKYTTDMYEGMLAETITIKGHNGAPIKAYFARPLGAGPFPGVVLVHHMPGWDALYRDFTRRFASYGYMAICPNLYNDFGDGTPEEVAAKARAAGGVADADVVADAEAASSYLKSLPESNGKVAGFGTCSGGRHAFVVACSTKAFDALVECWGGRVVMQPQDLTPKMPKSPVDMTKDLSCPILGLFGNDDKAPSPAQVDQHEAELKKHGKNYEFHRYDGAGHGFFYYLPSPPGMYRQEQATDGWNKIWAFLDKYISK